MAKQFAFSQTPVLKRSRSRFDLSGKVLTSFNMGQLVPFYIQEVYPGDTMKVDTMAVIRTSSSLIRPIMDNLFLDTYFFYVPSRLVYDSWANIFGENTESAWANDKSYRVPTLSSGTSVVVQNSVADYLGLPIGLSSTSANSMNVSVLPFRAYALIWNEWFRDQNNMQPMHIQKGDSVSSEVFNSSVWSPSNYTGMLAPVSKMHDYFTSCLPAPQKGNAVGVDISMGSFYPLTTGSADGSLTTPFASGSSLMFQSNNVSSSTDVVGVSPRGGTSSTSLVVGYYGGSGLSLSNHGAIVGSNLGVDLSEVSTAFNINDLRLAFQLQKMLERDARGGTRYVEYLLSHFGVSAGDARLQRPEFLGGRRSPLNITQVTATNATPDADTGSNGALGDLGATSLSASRARATKAFVEHGYLIGVCCVRQFHTYQQGVARFWRRNVRTDFYDPVFANIGEQPVYTTELYSGADSTQVFGYNEAWADLRYRPNMVTAQMRSAATDSLDIWHLADNYSSAPVLAQAFISETPTYLDRVLSVESSVQNQFICDFYVKNIAYRELPTYSIPSLIDHN